MAYSFDRVMGSLGKQPEDKVDIFGNGGGQASSGPAPGLGSNTEGELGPSGGGDVSNAKNPVTSPSDVSTSAAYRANLGKSGGPDLGAMRSGLDAKGKALDNEASGYLSTRAALQPSALSASDGDQLHGALDKNYHAKPSGDGPTPYDTGAQPRDSVGYWASVANSGVEKVDPFKSNVDLSDPGVESIGTDAGVQNLLRRQGGAEYNAGDASFDAALLGQDPGFQQGRQDLTERYKGLHDRQDKMATDVTGAAQRGWDASHSAYLADLRHKLQGFQGQFEGEAQDKEKTIEDQAAAREASLIGSAGDVVGQHVKDLSAAPGDLAKFYSADGIDPSQYAHGTFDAGNQDYKAYLSDDDALRFNNIMSILGSKDIYSKGAHAGGYADSDLVNYDNAGLDSALTSGAKGRYDADQARLAAIKATQDKIAAADAADKAAAEEQARTAASAKVTGQISAGIDAFGRRRGTQAQLPGDQERRDLENQGMPAPIANGMVPNVSNAPFTPAPLRSGGLLHKTSPENVRKTVADWLGF